MTELRLFRPETILEAAALLADDPGRRCLAGGGLVVPELKRAPPGLDLVSLRRVAGLRGVRALGHGGVRVGAATTHAELARAPLLAGPHALVRLAAAQVAHPVIRATATIGGSVCARNPAADHAAALLTADATLVLGSVRGERRVPVADFAVDRAGDELLVAIELPAAQASCGYARFARVDGDYPAATAAVRLVWESGRVAGAWVAVGGAAPAAYRVPSAEALLAGIDSADDAPAAFFDAYREAARPVDDIKASAAYRRRLIPVLLRRALADALAGRPA